MCGSIAIPFRAAPAVSDICVSNDGPIRHYFPSRRRQAWTARARVTGISPLRGSLRAAPTACGCGWTGVSLSPLPVMAVPGAARYLQLVVSRSCGVGNTRLKSMVGICLPLAPQIMAQPLMWLMLITTAKGMYLMNGYSVVKDQAKGHPVDRLSPNVLKTGGCQPCSSKKFFNLAIARLRDFATA